MHGPSRQLRSFARLAALVAALASGAARADTMSLRYVPTYTLLETEADPVIGSRTYSQSQSFGQRFTLGLDKSLFPTLSWSASGLLDWNKTWLRDPTDTWTTSDGKRWIGNTRLDYANGPLRSGISYGRRDAMADVTTAGVSTSSRGPIADQYGFSLLWNPADLPRVTAIASRTNTYDLARTSLDRTADALSLGLDYSGIEHVALQYGFAVSDSTDHLGGNESLAQNHTARIGWGDDFLDRRLSTFASYQFGYQQTRTTSGRGGATQETRRLPSSGLSKVESFPDTPTRVTLASNPALVDQDRTTGAGPGLSIGHARTTAGDTAFRDLGAQFPEDRLDFNQVRVWVDRPLPPAIVAGFTWEAYRSDDNITWTPVTITGPVVFAQLDNRFEIPVERTSARYVKVVTRPLSTAVSTDPLYSEILLTELEFYLVELLPPGVTRDSSISGTLNGSLRYVILRDPSLAYDLAVGASHRSNPADARGSVEQSLGFGRDLSPKTHVTARVLRGDAFDKTGHAGQESWGAALSSDPLPVLGWNLNYTGNHQTSARGWELSNSFAAAAHADLYKDVSTSLSSAYRWARFAGGQYGQSVATGAALSVVPHPALSTTGTFTYALSQTWGAGVPSTTTRGGRLDGTVTLNPIPALYLSATGGKNVFGSVPQTQTAVNAGLSLFQGGALSLRFGYGQTSDSLSRSRGRNLTTGLGWTIAPGRAVLGLDYSRLFTHTPVEDLRSAAFTASLQLKAL